VFLAEAAFVAGGSTGSFGDEACFWQYREASGCSFLRNLQFLINFLKKVINMEESGCDVVGGGIWRVKTKACDGLISSLPMCQILLLFVSYLSRFGEGVAMLRGGVHGGISPKTVFKPGVPVR
jgi:hypothetical protein